MIKELTYEREDGFTISTNKEYLNINTIHHFLANESYWVPGITKQVVKTSVEHSAYCYGIYKGNPSDGQLVGFARVISDLTRFSWLGDVFVLPDYRGIGLSKWLVETIVNNPYLKGIFTRNKGCTWSIYSIWI